MGVRVKCPQAVPGQENIPELLATNKRQPSENAVIVKGIKAWLSNVSFLQGYWSESEYTELTAVKRQLLSCFPNPNLDKERS